MKKTVVIFLLIATIALSLSPCSLAAYEDEYNHQEMIEPRYEVISYITTIMIISDSGLADCEAAATTYPGYRAEILAELQRLEGRSWVTIKDWTGAGNEYAETSGYWYVMPGYSYRLKATVTIYDTYNKIVETEVEYSNIEEY